MKWIKIQALTLLSLTALNVNAQNTPEGQMEKLDRGLIVIPSTSTKHFVSWRMLGTDNEDETRFDILRNGAVIAKDVYATCYATTGGNASSEYQVVTKVNG